MDHRKVIQRFYRSYKLLHDDIEKKLLNHHKNSSLLASIILDRMMILYFLQHSNLLPENILNLKYEEFEGDNSLFHNFLMQLLTNINTEYKNRKQNSENIPYLNLSILNVTEELKNLATYNINYGKILKEFNKYDWEIHEKSNGLTITPKVLGYVFEKYINQKEMGAYYTEEDTTNYITKNSILLSLINNMKFKDELIDKMEKTIHKYPNKFIVSNNKSFYDYELRNEKLKRKLKINELTNSSINLEVLIKNNIDILFLLRCTLENEKDENLLIDIFNSLKKITILDPTCGTGAFIFKALEILLELFDLLDSIHKKITNQSLISIYFNDNEKEFKIIKYCIENILFGVDIMEESIEILKTRMYLRLLACFNEDIKSFPNIKDNFKIGNTLVGEITLPDDIKTLKELNLYTYNKINNELLLDLEEFNEWVTKVKPFHWAYEFRNIINNGGFDCIIGNPPYVEYSKISKTQYKVIDYDTISCGNIYAFVLERSYQVLKDNGILGMIVPLSIVSTPRMYKIRKLLRENSRYIFYSNFGDRPGTLFSGVHQKLTIVISQKGILNIPARIFSTGYYHWYKEERKYLFDNIHYVESNQQKFEKDFYFKLGDIEQKSILNKILSNNTSLYDILNDSSSGEYPLYLSMRMTFWTKAFLNEKKSNEFKKFNFENELDRNVTMALLNSNIFFCFWEVVSDCWHITSKELRNFKFDIERLDIETKKSLSNLAIQLESQLESSKVYIGSKQIDYEYRHKKCKSIIDLIDNILASHYSLTKEEENYLKFYQLKYRMSDEVDIYLKEQGGI